VRILSALLTSLFFLVSITRAAESPTSDLTRWSVEQMPGGTVRITDDALEIEDARGSTVWLRQKLTAPVEITYEVTVV
jgi:hypothetical protein